ncbi:MAG: trypsin-like peptidase domain-containing protein [Hyphomonadaceae bacterium]
MTNAKGSDGNIVGKLGDLAVGALRRPRRETLLTLLPDVAASRPLKKDEEYVRVRMLAARLPDAGNVFSSKFPLVYAGVGLGEIANEPAGFAKAISSAFSQEGMKGEDRETLGEVVLFNASPYAGALNLALGLLSVRSSSRAKELLKKVAELSEKAATPFIGEAAKTIGAVASSIDLLTSDGNYFELGLMKSMDAPATGVYAVYSDRGKEDEDVIFGFANSKLINVKTGAALRRSYIVISIEALETRDDAHTIPRLRKKFDQVIEEIEKGADEERVRALIQEYAGLAAIWPDLLKADQDNLVKAAREKFKAFRQARTGFESRRGFESVTPEDEPARPTLDTVMADAMKARFGWDEAAATVGAVTDAPKDEVTAQSLTLEEISERLPKAVDRGDMLAVSAFSAAAVAAIQYGLPPYPQMPIKRIMQCLRAARRFNDMKLVSEKLLAQGERKPLFMKLYGQALIELKDGAAAELVLKQAEDLAKHTHDSVELVDIYGSLGRIHKDRFVEIDPKHIRARQLAFDKSLGYYRLGKKLLNKESSLYHTVNVMALAFAGHRAGLKVPKDLSPKHIRKLAEQVRAYVDGQHPNIQDWDYANAAEAALALEDYPEARRRLDEYARENIRDAFSLNSTLRQITTLWGVAVGGKHGDVVEGLQMALMAADNGVLFSAQGVQQLLNAPNEARFEAIFNGETGISVQTAYKALAMSCFVGKVLYGDRPKGTGFLVRSADLLPAGEALLKKHGLGEWLFLTNAHVISPTGEHGAIPHDSAQIEFQMASSAKRFKALRTVWSSSATGGHDCTIVELDGHPQFGADVSPARISAYLPRCRFAVGETGARPRVLVLGHPDGRALEITFNNNLLLDHDGPSIGQPFGAKPVRVQYRAPTEPGSSGSPVFDADTLELIAIHHRGAVAPIDPTFGDAIRYQANQGMSLRAIMLALQAALGGAATAAAAPPALAQPVRQEASSGHAATPVNEAAFEALRGYAEWEDEPGFESLGWKSDRKLPRQCGDFIASFEVSSPAYYKAKLQAPCWPGGESGLTIGVGYDLRHASAAEFREHWSALLPAVVIDRLLPYCGKAEPDLAKRKLAVAALKDIAISLEAATTVFTAVMLPMHTLKTEKCFPNTGDLHDIGMGALVSLVFNRGPGLGSDDSRKEMRNIAAHMKAKAFDKVAGEIRDMKRIWQDKAGVAGLLDRRDKEAAAFEEGLRLQLVAAKPGGLVTPAIA